MRQARVTASRYYVFCHVQGESSGQALTRRILKGVPQVRAALQEWEPQVLEQYPVALLYIWMHLGAVMVHTAASQMIFRH